MILKIKGIIIITNIIKTNNKRSKINNILLKENLETKGDKKRRRTNIDYHSSDGRRGSLGVNNLISFQYQLSQGKLHPLKHKNNTEVESSTINVENNKKNIPSFSQNVSNLNLNEGKEIITKQLDDQRNKTPINRKSKIKVYKWKQKLPSMDDGPSRNKMSTYVFCKKDEKNQTNIDKSSTAIDPPTPQNKSGIPHDVGKEDHDRIKEENYKLIEQMLKNRKRQYSWVNELNGQFNSKLLQRKNKPHRKVIRKIVNKNTIKKDLIVNKSESNNHSSESSTQSTKNKTKPNNDTPDLQTESRIIDNIKSKFEEQTGENK